ncbi:MAG: 5-bromo-4-chloroindolyl phosphate hydrolysis family protein, partial [Oscillospiraceae bacterium]|nr:5-bromo-4-chloroindolyl phosphate hydrolysis family protein [Oscillospiraceae bacterium]
MKRNKLWPLYGFAGSWAASAAVLPMYKGWAIVLAAVIAALVAFLLGRSSAKKELKKEQAAQAKVKEQAKAAAPKKSYGPEIDPIVAEGNRALSEMGRLYMSIKDTEVRQKINEIMRITDKITQDAIADPSDIPQ